MTSWQLGAVIHLWFDPTMQKRYVNAEAHVASAVAVTLAAV